MFQYETRWTFTKSKWTTGLKLFRQKYGEYKERAKDVTGWLGYEIERAPRSFARWKEQKVMRQKINVAADLLTRQSEKCLRKEGMSLDEYDRKNAPYQYVGDLRSPSFRTNGALENIDQFIPVPPEKKETSET